MHPDARRGINHLDPQRDLMTAIARLAQLELAVEEIEIATLRRRLADGSERSSALLRLRGVGEEGVGEEVTFQHDDLLAPDSHGAGLLQQRVPWAGVRTLGELWTGLDSADLFARPPRWDVVRSYRRWAIEAAALDLALRRAGLTFPELIGREPSPVRFVASPAHGQTLSPPAGVGLKLDAPAIDPGLPVEIVDFKGEGDGGLVLRVRELYPDALLEDPPFPVDGARISWDVRVRSADDLDRLPAPAAINVKPARVGSIAGVLALLDACAARGIATYGGGQFELGPGRGQAQLLASLFYPDAPNDLAPAPYNDASPSGPLPPSPLVVVPRLGFGVAD